MAPDGHLIRLQLPSSFELLDLVQVLSDRCSSMAGLDEDAAHWVSVSVRESVINAIKHGNKEAPDKKVTVAFELTPKDAPEQFVIEVLDEGEGFDPGDVADPLDPANVLQLHGRSQYRAPARGRHGRADEQETGLIDARPTIPLHRHRRGARRGPCAHALLQAESSD